MRVQTVITVLTLILALGRVAQATVDPSIDWRVIETPHFLIIHDSRQQALGETYATFAEQAFSAVAPVFGVWPEKTVVVLDDSTDLSNGGAIPIPYPMIVAYPVLPSALASIGDFGDWGLELMTHEYTHILNFEPANGVYRPLRWVFGSIVRPNILLPHWYSEGLAVAMETRYSNYGRLRSVNYLAIIRSMVRETTLRTETIGRIGEAIPDWPGGMRPYLMGALLWDDMIRRGGIGVVGDLNTAYSRRFPFTINGPVRSRLGLPYQTLLSELYDRLEATAVAQMIKIKGADGAKEESVLSEKNGWVHSPAFSPDGKWLASVAHAHNKDSYIVLQKMENGAAKEVDRRKPEGESINRVSWFPDSKSFVYDSVSSSEPYRRYYNYSELWRYDIDDKKAEKLTDGARAREPMVSRDGKSIVFVQSTPGSTRLAVAKADGTEIKIVYTPPLQTRVSFPDFLDSDTLIFSERRDDGVETMRTVKIDGASQPQTVLAGFIPARFPRVTRDGVLFTSEKSGVSNLFLAPLDLKTAHAVTNTLTQATAGDIDPVSGDLVFSRLDAAGPELYTVKKSELAKAVTPPAIDPLIANDWPKYEKAKPSFTPERYDYSALGYMVPRYWMPWIYSVPGGVYVEAATSASDPLHKHTYSLSAAYDAQTARPNFFGEYTNETTWFPTTIYGQDIHEYTYTTERRRHTSAAGITSSFYIPGLSEDFVGGLGWRYLQNDLVAPFGLTTAVPVRSDIVRQGPAVTFSYTGAEQRGLEISPETGGNYSVTHIRYLPLMSSVSYEDTEVFLSRYFSGFILPERHVIAVLARASVMPRLDEPFMGRTTLAGAYQNQLNFAEAPIPMRGYLSGTFIGRDLLQGTLEYRFPLSYNYRGFGTAPLFLRRVHAAIFGDWISLDGLVYNNSSGAYRAEKLGRTYFGTGAELKFDVTAFYFAPLQFVLGLYYGTDRNLNPDGVLPFVGIGL